MDREAVKGPTWSYAPPIEVAFNSVEFSKQSAFVDVAALELPRQVARRPEAWRVWSVELAGVVDASTVAATMPEALRPVQVASGLSVSMLTGAGELRNPRAVIAQDCDAIPDSDSVGTRTGYRATHAFFPEAWPGNAIASSRGCPELASARGFIVHEGIFSRFAGVTFERFHGTLQINLVALPEDGE